MSPPLPDPVSFDTASLPASYQLATDNDGHWYVIPCRCRGDWQAWRALPGDDERAWEPPGFAQALNGSPECVSFPAYTVAPAG